jgi:hypothetical protein
VSHKANSSPEVAAAKEQIVNYLSGGGAATQDALCRALTLPTKIAFGALKSLRLGRLVCQVGKCGLGKPRTWRLVTKEDDTDALFPAPVSAPETVARALAARPAGVPAWFGGAA